MTSTMRPSSPTPMSRGKKITFVVVIFGLGVVLALGLAELFLRLVPVPGVSYQSYSYDEVTGGTLHPNSRVIYQNARGDLVRRSVNRWGYLDVDHAEQKPRGTYRIGFFGDSYTEARQVPIDTTFVRRIERRLNAELAAGALDLPGGPYDHVETISFGIAGRSTVQSYLDCGLKMKPFGLDCVVYVMCENDPGDQIEEIRRAAIFPFAYLEADSFRADFSFRKRYAFKKSWWYRARQLVNAHSLVLSTLQERIRLLLHYGARARIHSEDFDTKDHVPPGTAPSSWPSDSLLTYARELQGRIIRTWRRDVTRDGREFIVMYVPWEHSLGQPLESQDSWDPWLHHLCDANHIALIDPSPQLIARRDRGEEIHYDHLTSHGHAAFSDAFVGYFTAQHALHPSTDDTRP